MIPSLTVCVGDIFPRVQERRVGQRGNNIRFEQEREKGRGDKTVGDGGRDAKLLLDI